MKKAAALDTSFWVNAYRAELYQYLPRYFEVAYCSRVREEIEVADPNQPTIIYPDTQAFRVFCEGGLLTLRDPRQYDRILGEGESQAMALAKQEGRLLLIDDFAAYTYAANVLELPVLDSATFLLFLCRQGIFNLKGALGRLERLERSISKQLLEPAREAIEMIIAGRRKEKS